MKLMNSYQLYQNKRIGTSSLQMKMDITSTESLHRICDVWISQFSDNLIKKDVTACKT
jgi:hypothetical protein